MNINIKKSNRVGLLKNFLSDFCKKKDVRVLEHTPNEVISKEIDRLWKKIRETEDADKASDTDLSSEIGKSFYRLRKEYTNDQLDEFYVWSRYVKIAAYCMTTPLEDLVNYVTDTNYVALTKRLSDLSKHIHNGENDKKKKYIDQFSEAVYFHIVNDVNPDDIPANLALGRISQDRGDYESARKWYLRILDRADSFNGLTALLACNEEEIKNVLADKRLHDGRNAKLKKLNEDQCELYEKWCAILKDRMNKADVTELDLQKEYVTLLTGYARFEKNRNNYEKAISLLESIPESFPEVYRAYTEKAMLYQFRPYNNPYYNLAKAIDTFLMADKAINEEQTVNTISAKSQKSILVPLANTYYQAGRFEDALKVSDIVLKIDPKEQRAIRLKDRITKMIA